MDPTFVLTPYESFLFNITLREIDVESTPADDVTTTDELIVLADDGNPNNPE